MNELIAMLVSAFSHHAIAVGLRKRKLTAPAHLCWMLAKEHPQYIAAAILAVNQRGE